ncbi:MAG TPA: ABC transporter permease [Lactovum miscens]|uniref:ABC transporter permease n=1 Tax=Lactovum miscens TaxID=190387 RepID=UPI002EDBA317
MKEVFAKRRKVYYKQNIKYLRYVFNDHFMLFLVIVLGTLAVQYAKFLQYNDLKWELRLLIAFVISLIALVPGKVVSLLEGADSTFLLAKEEELKKYLKRSENISLVFPALIILILVLITSPLLKVSIFVSSIWFMILVLIKKILFRLKIHSFEIDGNVDFEGAISYEQKRRTNLLKIFALFTNVKGLTNTAKRRKYLDPFLPKKTTSAYEYLLWRTFLRTSDYVGMLTRLLFLSVLVLIFVTNTLFAVLFATVVNYLLIFQILSIEKSQDYQPLLKVYPIHPEDLTKAVKSILLKSLSLFLLVEYLFSGIFGFLGGQLDFILLLVFYILSPIIFIIYIKYRLKEKNKSQL